MKSVILITNKPLDLEYIGSRCLERGVHDIGRRRPLGAELVVKLDSEWFSVHLDQQLADGFDAEEMREIERVVHSPTFAQIRYSNLTALNMFINCLPDKMTALIDNDFGLRATLDEIRRRASNGAAWNLADS